MATSVGSNWSSRRRLLLLDRPDEQLDARFAAECFVPMLLLSDAALSALNYQLIVVVHKPQVLALLPCALVRFVYSSGSPVAGHLTCRQVTTKAQLMQLLNGVALRCKGESAANDNKRDDNSDDRAAIACLATSPTTVTVRVQTTAEAAYLTALQSNLINAGVTLTDPDRVRLQFSASSAGNGSETAHKPYQRSMQYARGSFECYLFDPINVFLYLCSEGRASELAGAGVRKLFSGGNNEEHADDRIIERIFELSKEQLTTRWQQVVDECRRRLLLLPANANASQRTTPPVAQRREVTERFAYDPNELERSAFFISQPRLFKLASHTTNGDDDEQLLPRNFYAALGVLSMPSADTMIAFLCRLATGWFRPTETNPYYRFVPLELLESLAKLAALTPADRQHNHALSAAVAPAQKMLLRPNAGVRLDAAIARSLLLDLHETRRILVYYKRIGANLSYAAVPPTTRMQMPMMSTLTTPQQHRRQTYTRVAEAVLLVNELIDILQTVRRFHRHLLRLLLDANAASVGEINPINALVVQTQQSCDAYYTPDELETFCRRNMMLNLFTLFFYFKLTPAKSSSSLAAAAAAAAARKSTRADRSEFAATVAFYVHLQNELASGLCCTSLTQLARSSRSSFALQKLVNSFSSRLEQMLACSADRGHLPRTATATATANYLDARGKLVAKRLRFGFRAANTTVHQLSYPLILLSSPHADLVRIYKSVLEVNAIPPWHTLLRSRPTRSTSYANARYSSVCDLVNHDLDVYSAATEHSSADEIEKFGLLLPIFLLTRFSYLTSSDELQVASSSSADLSIDRQTNVQTESRCVSSSNNLHNLKSDQQRPTSMQILDDAGFQSTWPNKFPQFIPNRRSEEAKLLPMRINRQSVCNQVDVFTQNIHESNFIPAETRKHKNLRRCLCVLRLISAHVVPNVLSTFTESNNVNNKHRVSKVNKKKSLQKTMQVESKFVSYYVNNQKFRYTSSGCAAFEANYSHLDVNEFIYDPINVFFFMYHKRSGGRLFVSDFFESMEREVTQTLNETKLTQQVRQSVRQCAIAAIVDDFVCTKVLAGYLSTIEKHNTLPEMLSYEVIERSLIFCGSRQANKETIRVRVAYPRLLHSLSRKRLKLVYEQLFGAYVDAAQLRNFVTSEQNQDELPLHDSPFFVEQWHLVVEQRRKYLLNQL